MKVKKKLKAKRKPVQYSYPYFKLSLEERNEVPNERTLEAMEETERLIAAWRKMHEKEEID